MKTALAVLAAVFKWIGIVLGALILLLLLLSLFPLRLDVEWRTGELKADAGYLFFRKKLLPKRKPKAEKEEGNQEASAVPDPDPLPEDRPPVPDPDPLPEERPSVADPDPLPPEPEQEPGEEEDGTREDPPREKEKGGLQELWETVEPFLDPGIRAVRYLGRHVQVKDVHASLECVSSDAAVTGMLTGAKWAFLGGVSKTLNDLFGRNVSYGELKVTPCWTKDTARGEEAGCRVRLRPIAALAAGVIFLAGWLPKRRRNRKKKKETPSEA